MTTIPNCQCRIAFGLLALLACAGCSGGSYPATVPVHGRLTYGGDDWPRPGRIFFTPLEPAAGFPRRAGTARFETGGRFHAGTWKEGEGLLPGRYRVSIECWKEPPSVDNPKVLSYVPIELQIAARSEWEIEVAPGGEAVVIERDVPKIE